MTLWPAANLMGAGERHQRQSGRSHFRRASSQIQIVVGKHMPLSIIWLVTSFAIRLLVIYFRLVLLFTSRAKALARIGRPRERGRTRRPPSWWRLPAKRTPARKIPPGRRQRQRAMRRACSQRLPRLLDDL